MMPPYKLFFALVLSAIWLTACSSGTDASESLPAPQTETTAQTEPATPPVPSPSSAVRPSIQTYEIVATYPHDKGAFTQGLFFWEGALYESTGRHGESTIRRVKIETGEVEQSRDLPPEYFGEGITRWQDTIIALTWRSGTGFVVDLETFSPIDAFGYPGEGWGLTSNDTQLIQSDGSPILRFLDPETFEIKDTLAVSLNGRPMRNINELEWINGEIWANVWQSDLIARIDPETGNVTAVIDFTGLFPDNARVQPNDDVLNGIAHDPETGRLFITGKHWPNLYEIKVSDLGSPN